MKPQLTLILIFSLTFYNSQQILYKQEFKKCQKEFNKKICLSDEDRDDILFYLDQCPKVGGSPENFGCPLPDTDGDGVIDIDDTCPDVAGQTENNGCPFLDTDGDGILDNIDVCPTVPGIPEKQGCPGRKTFSLEEIQTYQNKMLENQKPVDFSKMAYLILERIDKEKMKKQVSYLHKNDKKDKEIIFLVIRSNVGAICGNETNLSIIPPTDNLANKIFWTEENFSIFFNFFSSYRVIPIEETEGMSYNEIKLYTPNELKEIFDFSKLTYSIGVEKESRSKFVVFNTLKTSTEIDLKSKYIMLEVIIKMQVNSKKYRVEFDTNFQDIKYFNLEYNNGSFKEISDEELFDNKDTAKSLRP